MQRLALLVIAVIVLGPFAAWAEGVSAYIEPDYSNIVTRTTDQFGRTTTSKTDELAQHYQLALDKTLYPYVRFNGVGLFEQTLDWTITDGVRTHTNDALTNGVARLTFGPPVLGADLGFERRDEWTSGSLSPERQHLVSDRYSAGAGWRPADLPNFDMRLSRTDLYDSARRVSDLTTDEALFTANYTSMRQLNLGYTLDWQHGLDHLTGTDTTALTNTARALYNDSFNGGRTTVLGSYTINNRLSDTAVQGVGGIVAQPQIPSAGLSLIETLPALPENDTLGQNPALVDGNTATSANVNVGYSVALGGDTNFRDVGVEFTDPTTPVNALYVWVDKQLPEEIANGYLWTAYSSDDNINWTRVGIVGPVIFGMFQNRFEITIERTTARYLKVVTRPLGVAVTADKRFADVFITEVQPMLISSAQSVRGHTSATVHTATGALHQEILSDRLLSYDFSGTLTHAPGTSTYVVLNSLSLERRLAQPLMLSLRAGRQDTGVVAQSDTSQHSGAFQYSGSLVATPIPTLTDSFTYTGQYAETPRGTAELNAVTLINRAQLYKGVDVLVSLGYTYNVLDTGVTDQGPTVIATASFVPSQILTLGATYYLASIHETGAVTGESQLDTERVDGNLSFTPFRALYLSGTVSRIIKGARPTTLATFGGSFSPFPDGSLLLRLSYTESLDTSTQMQSRVATAGLRWNLTPRAALDTSYTVLDSSSDIGSSNTRQFMTGLVLQL